MKYWKFCPNTLFQYNKNEQLEQTAHRTSTGTEPSSSMLLAWVHHEWLATRSNYHTADVILLLWNELWSQASSCQPTFHSSEARQAQAAGEAVNGHGNFTLSPLQVRMKLQCWEACTMLRKFIVVTAKRGSLRPSNMTCCITQPIQFELVTPCHIVLSFFLSLLHFLIFFSFCFCLVVFLYLIVFNTRKLQIPQLPVHHL